jgi:hypothetical protein
VQQFRMVHQELLDRTLDQGLHCHAAQHGGTLELTVFRFGNAGAGGRFRPGFTRDFGATMDVILLVFLVAILTFCKFTILLSSLLPSLVFELPVPQVIGRLYCTSLCLAFDFPENSARHAGAATLFPLAMPLDVRDGDAPARITVRRLPCLAPASIMGWSMWC